MIFTISAYYILAIQAITLIINLFDNKKSLGEHLLLAILSYIPTFLICFRVLGWI